MSFVAQCPYCQSRVRVPSHAQGRSATCPRCGNAFTLVRPDKKLDLAQAVLERPAEDAVPQPPVSASKRFPAGTAAAAGVLALVLASLAVPTLSFAGWRMLTLALAGLALLAAALATVASEQAPVRANGKAVAATFLAVPALLVAGFWPGLLGTSPPPAGSTMSFDPHGALLIPRTSGNPEPAPAWADADLYSLQVGDMRIRVTAARLEGGEGSTPGNLRLDLHVFNVGMNRLAPYRGWGRYTSGSAEATLSDASGRLYRLLDGGVRPDRARSLVPFARLADFLVFQAPPSELDCVFLELPATATGWPRFGFRIPRSMFAVP